MLTKCVIWISRNRRGIFKSLWDLKCCRGEYTAMSWYISIVSKPKVKVTQYYGCSTGNLMYAGNKRDRMIDCSWCCESQKIFVKSVLFFAVIKFQGFQLSTPKNETLGKSENIRTRFIFSNQLTSIDTFSKTMAI